MVFCLADLHEFQVFLWNGWSGSLIPILPSLAPERPQGVLVSTAQEARMTFSLSSPAFLPGHPIPPKYTADGDNLSPPLEWRGAPHGTKSFALVVEDPDAPSGTFRHWALFNISAGRDRLPAGVGHGTKTEDLGLGVNDFGHPHYDGPKPPKGDGTHHYHFKLAALDVETLSQAPKARAEDVWNAAREHVIADTELVGTYERR
jgi:Raf kinase inhibitor-like YbhB/YbcL family protein